MFGMCRACCNEGLGFLWMCNGECVPLVSAARHRLEGLRKAQ